MPKRYTPTSAAADVEAALRILEGSWKLVILFHLFGGKVMRFSDLERAILESVVRGAGRLDEPGAGSDADHLSRFGPYGAVGDRERGLRKAETQ